EYFLPHDPHEKTIAIDPPPTCLPGCILPFILSIWHSDASGWYCAKKNSRGLDGRPLPRHFRQRIIQPSCHDPAGIGSMSEPRSFTTVGPEKGTILWKDRCGAIGVYAFPDTDTEHVNMPIGTAMGGAWDDLGRKTWRIVLKKGGELPGLWIVVD